MTLQGACDKLRTDPIHAMFVLSLGFYTAWSTLEGPMMSIRAVNSLSHYTDLDHRSRPLGWSGLERHDPPSVPSTSSSRVFGVREKMYSMSAIQLALLARRTLGIVLYASSMWVSGIMEGLMWREVDDQGFRVNSFAGHCECEVPDGMGCVGLGGGYVPQRALIMLGTLYIRSRCKACCRLPSLTQHPAE